MIPFTTTEFLDVFQRYNNAVWPAQLALYLVALLAIGFSFTNARTSGKTISVILAVLWLWMGVVYHFLFFSRINQAAFLFGSLFIAQSIIFLFAGVVKRALRFQFTGQARGIVGIGLLLYATAIYPILGPLFGHSYPAAPTFGVPCPTTIFTFGILLVAGMRFPVYVVIIPLIWSALGFWAAASLGMIEDIGLFVAAVITALMIAAETRQSAQPTKRQHRAGDAPA